MIVVGVDYSMTCPTLCFMNTEWPAKFKCAGFSYLSGKKNEQIEWDVGAAVLVGKPIPPYENDTERFVAISTALLVPFVTLEEPVKFYIEGYSMGSKGKVFNIAEHAGMLKYFLWANNIKFEVVPPTVIKNLATGEGNADKAMMYAAFVTETGVSLMNQYPDRSGVSSPVTDIVDSFYIAKYGVNNELQTSTKQ